MDGRPCGARAPCCDPPARERPNADPLKPDCFAPAAGLKPMAKEKARHTSPITLNQINPSASFAPIFRPDVTAETALPAIASLPLSSCSLIASTGSRSPTSVMTVNTASLSMSITSSSPRLAVQRQSSHALIIAISRVSTLGPPGGRWRDVCPAADALCPGTALLCLPANGADALACGSGCGA